MKFTKMSLVAALLMGSSAFAIENTKVSGDANLYYNTVSGGNAELFDAASSAADIGVNFNVTTDLVKNDSVAISAGVGYTVLSTLGLENNLVNGVWGNAHAATVNNSGLGLSVDNADWVNEAWMATTAGKTTVKLGRMELDTPLAFTETWSIEKNTFEAAVVVNEDIPDTTLVAAYIGNGNGTETFGADATSAGAAMGGLVNTDGEFNTYGTDGAYAVGAVNNSWKPLTAQAWYYDVTRVATAYWLQGDIDASELGVEGLTMGGQFTGMTKAGNGTKEDAAIAAMIGYEMKDMFAARVAYSQVSSSGSLGQSAFNTATDMSTAQSKLYTEAWWNYGQVTIAGAKSVNLTVEAPTSIADLGLYVTSIDHKAANSDLLEVTASASKSMGPVDASLVYIYADVDDNADASNNLQVYLTLNF